MNISTLFNLRAAPFIALVLAGSLGWVGAQTSVAPLAPAVPASSNVNASAAKLSPLFVLNSLDACLSVVDPNTWKETQRIPTCKEPHHLYLTPDEK